MSDEVNNRQTDEQVLKLIAMTTVGLLVVGFLIWSM